MNKTSEIAGAVNDILFDGSMVFMFEKEHEQ